MNGGNKEIGGIEKPSVAKSSTAPAITSHRRNHNHEINPLARLFLEREKKKDLKRELREVLVCVNGEVVGFGDAKSLKLKFFEVPTVWKFFGNLIDVGLCSVCGEESFETVGLALPSDKLLLVEILKEQGQVVAFFGQRTDEAPSLRAADVGIAIREWSSMRARETTLQFVWVKLNLAVFGGFALLTKPSTDKHASLLPLSCRKSLITAEMIRNIVLQVFYQAMCSLAIELKGSALVDSDSADMCT
ncbi:calcium-transporting ATPase 12, plasma membrane-type-like protein [Tanacetum coccineum]